MFKIGIFKRIKTSIFPENETSKMKDDKRYIAVIAVFAAVIALTIIRAMFDESVAAQIRTLKFSSADGIMFLLAAGGYCILKRDLQIKVNTENE